MNSQLDALLAQTERALTAPPRAYHGEYRVGVDLGTAYTVLLVLDANDQPLAGAYRFVNVVRDGLVVDFIGAIDFFYLEPREAPETSQVYNSH